MDVYLEGAGLGGGGEEGYGAGRERARKDMNIVLWLGLEGRSAGSLLWGGDFRS